MTRDDLLPPRFIDLSPAEALSSDELRQVMADQTVFISSVMDGMTSERTAAREAVESLGANVSMFESLGGRDDDAQTAYLAGIRSSDIYVGILGSRYGKPDKSSYAPTHAEYNEAVTAGLRISVWVTTSEMDGRQRDFLNDIRTFHTTGSYASPCELRTKLEKRLAEIAATANSPWCKIGSAMFRSHYLLDEGTRIIIDASIRDDAVLAELERLRPDEWQIKKRARLTGAGRVHAVTIDRVIVASTPGRARRVTIEATKTPSRDSGMQHVRIQYGRLSPDDATELQLRHALFGEPIPTDHWMPMSEMINPLGAIVDRGLDDDSFRGIAEVLLVESLVGSGVAERITSVHIGSARGGRSVRIAWETPRSFGNTASEMRQIEGKLLP